MKFEENNMITAICIFLLVCAIGYALLMRVTLVVFIKQNMILQRQAKDLQTLIAKLVTNNDNLTLENSLLQILSNKSSHQFTTDELKKIRFSIHPDKNGGKNHELFIKLNEMIGE